MYHKCESEQPHYVFDTYQRRKKTGCGLIEKSTPRTWPVKLNSFSLKIKTLNGDMFCIHLIDSLPKNYKQLLLNFRMSNTLLARTPSPTEPNFEFWIIGTVLTKPKCHSSHTALILQKMHITSLKIEF